MILAIDTALAAASACLYRPRDGQVVAAETLEMQTGQAEALVPLIDRVVARSPEGFGGLTRVAATIGPGSFTGIRIGVAAARAIGLACRVPVVGVTTLAALAAEGIASGERSIVAAAIDARHGRVFIQVFGGNGATLFGPALLDLREAVNAIGAGPVRLFGSGAPLLAAEAQSTGLAVDVAPRIGAPDIAFVARLGALADPQTALPKPLYLKAPDAKPPAETRLLRLP